MKSIPLLRVALVFLFAWSMLPGRAATLTWNGGTGNWDLTTMNWLNGTAVSWSHTIPPHDAVFNAPAGTVSLLQDMSAGSLSFNNTGTSYTLTTSGQPVSLTINALTFAPGVTAVNFGGSLRVVANAANAISAPAPAGTLYFQGNSVLDAAVTGAVQGGYDLNMMDNSVLSVGATDALSSQARVVFWGTGTSGTLRLNGYSTTVGLAFSLSPATPQGQIENASPAPATLTVSEADAGAAAIFTGTIADGAGGGALSIVKNGNHTWTLSGANLYSGGTTLNAGGLYANSDSALGTGGFVINGGTFGSQIAGTYLTNDITINQSFQIAGPLASSGDGLLLTGQVALTTTPVITQIVSEGSVRFGNQISGAGMGLTLDATGDWGRFVFSGSNTYTGLTTVQGTAHLQLDGYFSTTLPGDLLIQNNGVVELTIGSGQQLATTSTVTVNSPGNTLGGTAYEGLVLDGTSVSLAALNGNGTVGLYGSSLTLDGGNFSGVMSDAGNPSFGELRKESTGTLILSGANTYAGGTTVDEGVLLVNNLTGSGTGSGDVNVNSAVLGGSGTIAGNVYFDDAVLRPGNSPGTLTILGDLELNSGSLSEFELGEAGVPGGPLNDLVNVGGDLTLAGDLAIIETTPGGTFGPGVYRLFNYGGTLTDDTMTIVSAPVPLTDLILQTSVANQINLVNTQGLQLNFWDGSGPADDGVVDGGSGNWISPDAVLTGQPFPAWTTVDGAFNAGWQNGSYAIFQGTGGGVVIASNSGAQVTLTGAQFAVDGYNLSGGALTGAGASTTFQVGDGTIASAAMTATISSVVEGATSLVKTGAGTLVLGGANTYTGGTIVSGGRLDVSSDTGLGDVTSGSLTLSNGSILRYGAGFSSGRPVTLDTGGGFFDTNGNSSALTGIISGTGGLTKTGAGTLSVMAVNTYAGNTTVTDGILTIGASGALPANAIVSITGASASLIFDQSSALGAAITVNQGAWVRFDHAGATAGTADINASDTGTTIGFFDTSSAGAAKLGVAAGARLGFADNSSAGTAVITNGAGGRTVFVAFGDGQDATIINQAGGAVDVGGVNTNTGASIGSLSGAGSVFLGAQELTVGSLGLNDVIVGLIADGGDFQGTEGALVKTGVGMLTLAGANTYSGTTTVSGGTLRINGDQSAATGLVSVNTGATLGGSGTIGGAVTINAGGVLSAGNSPGTLTILGDLDLNAGSLLDFELGQAGTPGGVLNDSLDVGGNLTLAGTLNITESTGGTFGPGVYRLFNYGTLTNNGLVIGSAPVPSSDLYVQTSVAQQVNLVNTNGLDLFFWDGGAGSASKNNSVIEGGNGLWENDPANDNWTTVDGTANAPWTSGGYAIFQGTAGTVTVPGFSNFGTVVFSGAQFAIDGYTLSGGALETASQGAILRVGDGTSAGAAYTATIASELTGAGGVEKTDAGTLVLTGDNTYTGGTVVSGGTLLVDNTTGSATGTGAVAVNASGVLGGTGVVTGPVAINSGGRIAGLDGQLLTTGALTLNTGSFTDVTLGAPTTTALFQVNGALTLGGTLNVIDGGGFGQGLYRLFNYTGGLTDNGMAITSGTLTGYAFSLQTSTANQVNLISLLGGPQSIWDGGQSVLHDNGAVNGGSGIWTADAADRNWTGTNGVTNGFWSQDAFVIFQGAPGTVTVDNGAGAVTFAGAQFAVDGYTLAGAALTTTTADTVLRVGEGTAAGSGYTATISAPITGAGGVRKTDFGTLVLSGANTYTGGTTVSSGTLQVAADDNLGAAGTALTLDGGTLRYGAGFASTRALALASGGVIDTQAYHASIGGGLSGAGALIKAGSGLLTLSGANTHTGVTTIAQGGVILQNSSLGQTNINAGAGLFGNGTIRGSLTNQGALSPGFSPGVIAVNGNFIQTASGSLFIELASPTLFDQVQVTGTSTLGGALVVSGLGGLAIQAGDTYRIIEATAINGQFDSLTSPWANLSPMIRFEALYSPTAVTLSFTQLPFTGLPGGSANQDSIGAALDTAFGQGRLPTLRGRLNAQPSQAAVSDRLRNVGPQRLARWFEQSNYISSAIVSSAAERLSDDVRVPQWNSWLELVHRESWFKGDDDVDGAKGSTNGMIAGADFAVTPDFVVGVLGGYTDEEVDLDLGGSNTGIARYTTGAYGRYDFSKLFFESVAGISYADYDSRRTTALNGQAMGDTRGAEHFASVKAGVPFDLGGFGFIPSTSVQHVRWGADRFSETGAGDENLTVFDQHGESITTRGNFTFSKKFKRDKKRLVIKTKLDVSWWHEVQQERRQINAEIGNVPFTVLSRLPNSDGYIMMFSADVTYRSFLTGFVRVTGEWSTTANRALEFRAGANYKF